jgi:formylglycine-generating enzyme required for sulfatase activity
MSRTLNPILLFAVLAASLLLTGCPTDPKRDTFDYLRSPVTFRMDPVPADHPFCADAAKRPNGMSEQVCRETAKYRLRWDRPEDTVGFAEYRIYVDTTPPNSTLLWSGVRKERNLASFILEGAPPAADSLIFFLTDTGAVPKSVVRSAQGLFALDTSGRLDSTGRLVFSIVTAYRESGLDGQPRYSWVITDDRFPPYAPQKTITPDAKGFTLQWERPRDRTSFFEPGADSGVIRAYFLRVVRGGILHANRPPSADSFAPTVTYIAGGVDRSSEVTFTSFKTLRAAPGRLFRLPDSLHVQNRNASDSRDSLSVHLEGLTPQDTIDIGFWAVDVAGNLNSTDTGAFTRVLLTDTTQPTTPLLRVVSSSRNGFVYAFTASRDRVPSGSGVVPADLPNANILEYRLTRKRIGGAGSGIADRDTVIRLSAAHRGDTLIIDSVRYLPPATSFLLIVQAVDSTGHRSIPDSLVIATTSVDFPGADSGLSCPPGFVAIPGGRFLRGDTATTVSTTDEKPALTRYQESYCIEQYEHRDNNGAFVTRKTWQEAFDACEDLSASLTIADSTWLCTESEWERACEGVAPDVPLVYGMQSEKRSSTGVRYTCNIGTDDSLMAMSSALRDPECISYDGAMDMAGNLSEWVQDPFTLSGYPATNDTLHRGVPHTALTSTSVRGYRGSNYLNPKLAPATLLARARCSNRDNATQSRPVPYAGCISATGSQLVVTYNNTSKAPRCLPLPDTIPASRIAAVSTARDSSQILLLLNGVAQPYVYQMPYDSIYIANGLKPVSAFLSKQTLAVVTFRNATTLETVVDTLHTTELLGASHASQEAVFYREAAPPWSAVKSGDAFVIDYLYAHIKTTNRAAKKYYSNAAMGFRCCSKPRP